MGYPEAASYQVRDATQSLLWDLKRPRDVVCPKGNRIELPMMCGASREYIGHGPWDVPWDAMGYAHKMSKMIGHPHSHRMSHEM